MSADIVTRGIEILIGQTIPCEDLAGFEYHERIGPSPEHEPESGKAASWCRFSGTSWATLALLAISMTSQGGHNQQDHGCRENQPGNGQPDPSRSRGRRSVERENRPVCANDPSVLVVWRGHRTGADIPSHNVLRHPVSTAIRCLDHEALGSGGPAVRAVSERDRRQILIGPG